GAPRRPTQTRRPRRWRNRGAAPAARRARGQDRPGGRASERAPAPNARLRTRVPASVPTTAPPSIPELQQRLAEQRYVTDRGLAVSLFIALKLGRPLFLAGGARRGENPAAA